MDGRARTAKELAYGASVTPQTASSHLARLLRGRLLTMERQSRHRYYQLAAPSIAHAVEALMAVSPPRSPARTTADPLDGLRLARTCYDHLAGRLGVSIMQALIAEGAVTGGDGLHHFDGEDRLSAPGRDVDYRLTHAGATRLERLGIEAAADSPLRYCVDWTEQAHHLSGPLGRALADRLLEIGWLRRADRGRAVHVTDAGADGLQREFRLSVR
jgi:hypothetical protein